MRTPLFKNESSRIRLDKNFVVEFNVREDFFCHQKWTSVPRLSVSPMTLIGEHCTPSITSGVHDFARRLWRIPSVCTLPSRRIVNFNNLRAHSRKTHPRRANHQTLCREFDRTSHQRGVRSSRSQLRYVLFVLIIPFDTGFDTTALSVMEWNYQYES